MVGQTREAHSSVLDTHERGPKQRRRIRQLLGATSLAEGLRAKRAERERRRRVRALYPISKKEIQKLVAAAKSRVGDTAIRATAMKELSDEEARRRMVARKLVDDPAREPWDIVLDHTAEQAAKIIARHVDIPEPEDVTPVALGQYFNSIDFSQYDPKAIAAD